MNIDHPSDESTNQWMHLSLARDGSVEDEKIFFCVDEEDPHSIDFMDVDVDYSSPSEVRIPGTHEATSVETETTIVVAPFKELSDENQCGVRFAKMKLFMILGCCFVAWLLFIHIMVFSFAKEYVALNVPRVINETRVAVHSFHVAVPTLVEAAKPKKQELNALESFESAHQTLKVKLQSLLHDLDGVPLKTTVLVNDLFKIIELSPSSIPASIQNKTHSIHTDVLLPLCLRATELEINVASFAGLEESQKRKVSSISTWLPSKVKFPVEIFQRLRKTTCKDLVAVVSDFEAVLQVPTWRGVIVKRVHTMCYDTFGAILLTLHIR